VVAPRQNLHLVPSEKKESKAVWRKEVENPRFKKTLEIVYEFMILGLRKTITLTNH